MAVEGTISLDNMEVEEQPLRNFSDEPPKILRFEEGKTFRAHFLSDEVLYRKRHFFSGDKKYYRCLASSGYCPICAAATKKVGECKKAADSFGTNLIVYDADPETGAPVEPFNGENHFWAFGADKFTQLRAIMKEYGTLTGVDLLITCVSQEYQEMKITAAEECLMDSSEEFAAECRRKFEEDAYPVDKFLCREQSMIELCETFSIDIDQFIPEAILRRIVGSAGSSGGEGRSSSAPAEEEAPFESLDNVAGLL